MKARLAILVPILIGLASLAWGQFRSAGDDVEAHLARDDSFDGKFHYCRAVYRLNPRGQGGSWLTDYPLADIYLSIRLSELTKIRVSFDASKQPNHLIVRLTGDELYRCPIILMQEVGRVYFSEEDATRLREYLLKGVPADHPIYHTLFDLDGVPQIPGIGTFFAGATSERGADSADVHVRAITDKQGRVMVFMTHNTDVSDSWEREGEDPTYFRQFSVNGYRVAVNVLLYAMTH
jgi:hypothetical protein